MKPFNIMKKIVVLVTVIAAVSTWVVATAQKESEKAATKPATKSAASEHKIVTPGELQWGDAPAGLPAGAKMAGLDGDPNKRGSFTVRLKAPAGYKILPHTHPTAERVTGISGTARLGMGERFDEATASAPPKDLDRLNEEARNLYYKEDCQIIDTLNFLIPEGKPKLRAPDPKFNRQIGDYAGKTYSVEGNPLSESEYQEHLKKVLPAMEDLRILATIFKEKNWMVAGNA